MEAITGGLLSGFVLREERSNPQVQLLFTGRHGQAVNHRLFHNESDVIKRKAMFLERA
jgi:hypothetical protein